MTMKISPRFRGLPVASFLGWAAVCSADEKVLSNFAGASYGDWKATGTAFQKGPASGDLLSQLEIENAGGAPVASS